MQNLWIDRIGEYVFFSREKKKREMLYSFGIDSYFTHLSICMQ